MLSRMYELALTVHSVLRLVLTIVCALVFLAALRGRLSSSRWSSGETLLVKLALIAADLQVVLGLLLWFLWSPQTSQVRANFGAAMKDPGLRFWAVEHPSAMLAAVACVHVGKVLAKRASNDAQKHSRTALWFGLALVLIALLSPWPYSGVARPIVHF